MTDEQQRVAERDFSSMWDALQEPVRALKRQVADLSRQSARAEVAGAVEVVSSLGSAGKKGRLAYLTTDDLVYYDKGTEWASLGGLTITPYSVVLGGSTTTSSTSFVNVTGSDISHTFTKDKALIVATFVSNAYPGTTQAQVAVQVDGVDGTIVGGVIGNNPRGGLVADTFTGLLSASSPATVRLRLRSSDGNQVSVTNQERVIFVIVEY